MKLLNKPYQQPFIFAMIMHGVILTVLISNLSAPVKKPVMVAKLETPIVQAVAVDQASVEKQINKIKAEQAAKKKRAQQQIAEAKRKLEQEAQHLAKIRKEAEQLKRQQIAKKKAVEKKLAEEKAKKQAAEKAKQLAEQKKQQQEKRLAQIAGEVDKYKALIIQSISRQWLIPEDVDRTLSAKFIIKLAPGGVVLDVKLTKSSGDAVLDRSAQTAIYKASPLPVPEESDVFDEFRELHLTVRPEGTLQV